MVKRTGAEMEWMVIAHCYKTIETHTNISRLLGEITSTVPSSTGSHSKENVLLASQPCTVVRVCIYIENTI